MNNIVMTASIRIFYVFIDFLLFFFYNYYIVQMNEEIENEIEEKYNFTL